MREMAATGFMSNLDARTFVPSYIDLNHDWRLGVRGACMRTWYDFRDLVLPASFRSLTLLFVILCTGGDWF
jgi:hypothetical protein